MVAGLYGAGAPLLFGVEESFVPFGGLELPDAFAPPAGFELPFPPPIIVGFAVVPSFGEFVPVPTPLVGPVPLGFAIGKPRPGMPPGAAVAPIPC